MLDAPGETALLSMKGIHFQPYQLIKMIHIKAIKRSLLKELAFVDSIMCIITSYKQWWDSIKKNYRLCSDWMVITMLAITSEIC